MKNLKSKIEKILLTLDLGYRWLMSDYAVSKSDEAKYEKEGLEQVNEVSDKLTNLFKEYVSGMEAMKEEKYPVIKGITYNDREIDGRNQLRQQIKAELKKDIKS